MSEQLHQLIYTSEIAENAPAGAVGDIVRHSRVKNKRLDLTGLLIFDGTVFCQYLEGPLDALAALRDIIMQDTRHNDYNEIYYGPSTEFQRRFEGWSIAYADVAEDQIHSLIHAGTGLAFVGALTSILPNLDIAPA